MISVTNLCKQFGEVNAVNNLSFTIQPGDVVGFLGPNGAGKSTTMKMLTGFLAPTSGEVRILEHDLAESRQQILKHIGYLPEGAPAYGDMTVIQFLDFVANVRGLSGEHKKARLKAVVQKVELNEVLTQTIETLSKGFKRRVGLAQALLHEPDILILDEPTDGLDPNQKHQVRQLIQDLSKDKIVIISTHILEEVSAVCNRAMIIADGKLLFDATPAELQQRSRYHKAVTLHLADTNNIEPLTSIDGVADAEVDEHTGRVTLFAESGIELMPRVTEAIKAHQLKVDLLYQEQGRLDDVFRQMTAGEAA
ncbi:Monosaccharide-transporting ATPase [Saliniradius amylolyticus]|uniref:Monosaccharide-transporting ATPase n=1 Tax=Saliniradius amylolyticus TaxID=2183582 RepID=A0A2S2E4J8_9ALTE|nr:ABC transporter ATP-binding protein [Saliniradius amylolyticus]AWL12588.1 Monosaccharide-transporting ATPase [Saliniradius amylolyticus]